MNYQEFLKYVEKHLASEMNAHEEQKRTVNGEDIDDICYEAKIHRIVKNNGIVLDGVTLLNKGENCGPNIYLQSYYEQYQMGKPLNHILEDIIIQYEKAKDEIVVESNDILDFSVAKDKIILRIVNYEKNAEQLKECPHKQILDLAVTFRYLADKSDSGIATSLVTNKELEIWDVNSEELYNIALENTIRDFPYCVESLISVVTSCFMDRLPKHLHDDFLRDMQQLDEIEDRINMYVLTNESGLNGATCILYKGALKSFAELHNTNLYVLPSSVHEVMLVIAKDNIEVADLKELVSDANQSAVGLIDFLSNSVYYYDKDKDELSIC